MSMSTAHLSWNLYLHISYTMYLCFQLPTLKNVGGHFAEVQVPPKECKYTDKVILRCDIK